MWIKIHLITMIQKAWQKRNITNRRTPIRNLHRITGNQVAKESEMLSTQMVKSILDVRKAGLAQGFHY
ncbi:hypothetical protein BST96_07315 [Oceanicoccus sagamiensis]|uniref:Uncharacterized protein n=1 Tax=Oceanicoccus sagamiensis TaxID=716816 RepID=A0A1X9N773_9GAMM|nr:hypothetical protein BST96_07315 [Oceanicoccus sagamiensis]